MRTPKEPRHSRSTGAGHGSTRTTPLAIAALLLVSTTLLSGSASADPTEPPTIDGTVTAGEYAFNVSLGNGHYDLYWTVVGDTIYFAILAQTTGFVALGIEPTKRMLDADIILGWRESTGDFELHDAWSTGERGPHPDDVDLGGTYDLLEYSATEVGGVTTIEFSRLLSTGDRYDHDIPANGTVKIIWSTSTEDGFTLYHSRRGTATIDIGTGSVVAIEYPSLWPIHAALMASAAILFVVTWFTVVHKKRLKKRFLNIHHWTGTAGFLCAAAGAVIGLYMVSKLGQGHFRILHAYLGVSTIVAGILAVTIGSLFLTVKKLKRTTRKPHIYLGAFAIICIVLTALAGLKYVYP